MCGSLRLDSPRYRPGPSTCGCWDARGMLSALVTSLFEEASSGLCAQIWETRSCTVHLLRSRCICIGMHNDVDKWIKDCQSCVKTKLPQPRVHPPMKSFLASRPLEVIAVDFTVLEPTSNRLENVLVVTDIFIIFTQAFPI